MTEGACAVTTVPEAPLGEGARAILITEFEQLSAAFLSNEQLGEGRVNIFIVVAGAVLAALGLSEKVTELPTESQALPVAALGLILVLGFGWFTLVRLVHRNLNTTDYLNKLERLRCAFVRAHPEVRERLPFPCGKGLKKRKLKWRWMLLPKKAGLVELVCFVNALVGGFLAAVLLLTVVPSESAAIVACLFATLLVWVLQFRFVRARYRRGLPPEDPPIPCATCPPAGPKEPVQGSGKSGGALGRA